MFYINDCNIIEIGINWSETIEVIKASTECLLKREYAQPIKPYLRYGDMKNRIIAMPGYIGGDFDVSGIKWIASFPDNIAKKIPRAHSIVILNKANTGQPVAIFNTPLISIIRTASVSGAIIEAFDKVRKFSNITICIIGWGPIGQYHLKMCMSIWGDRIYRIELYDLKSVDISNIDSKYKDKIHICSSWEEAYCDANIIITCTVSEVPYINRKPKEGALLLNVSLRDFKTNIYEYVNSSIFVDDWDEVCRENTDIEVFHKVFGLQKENTKSIIDILCGDAFTEYDNEEVIMFNPMGMAVFDIAIGKYYLDKAKPTASYLLIN
jgi:N-[(2S)-2-amino-2-carboxyethyl]-L-glutamate dehydrogenase